MNDMHEFRQKLAATLKEIRVKADLTQVELSGKLGVSVVHLSNLENGHSLPSIALLRTYMSVLGVDPYCVAHEI